jgi:uncharacterized membrane protein
MNWGFALRRKTEQYPEEFTSSNNRIRVIKLKAGELEKHQREVYGLQMK